MDGLKTKACSYHKLIHLDKSEQFQVNSSCESVENITSQSWFVLPPLMEYYYKSKNPFYKTLPPFKNDCISEEATSMQFIYPKLSDVFFLPKDFDGTTNELVLKIAHSKPETTVFWYIDDAFVGSTKQIHDMAILPTIGKHLITVVDEFGNDLKRWIEISE